MITRITKAVFLTASISSALMSCSKQEQVQPTVPSAAAASSNAQVKLVNGRVVFADLAALNTTQEVLDKLGNSQASTQALADWEKSLQFSSLRAAAKAEDSQLEALEAKGIPTLAHDLMYKFGFPTSYAALINPAGEYQVGDKIYWFHDGIKYQADSEEELAAIKKDPATAKVKLAAGSHIVKSLKGAAGQESRTTASNSVDSDGKWYYEYFQDGSAGSERRIKYVSSVYTEDRGTVSGGYYRNWYTQLSLQARHEYYSRGKRTWYPVGGQPFVWTVNVNYDATASAPYQYPATNPTRSSYINQQLQFDSGSYGTIVLATQNITTTTVDPYFRADSIKWDFEVTGSISGYNNNDRTRGTYNVSGLLW